MPEETAAILMPVAFADIMLIAENYPDRDEYVRNVSYDGANLVTHSQEVADKIAAINLAPARKKALIEYAAAKRWAVETGGITIGGVPIATDDRSKLMLTGARAAAQGNAEFSTKWVGADGNIYPLNAGQIIAIADQVLVHVAACFAVYADVQESISAGTVTTRGQVDAAYAAI